MIDFKQQYLNAVNFVKTDWNSNPVRFVFETIGMSLGIVIAVLFAMTIPNVPLHIAYPIFMTGLLIGMYSAISRNSMGLFVNNLIMFIVDVYGYLKIIHILQ